VPDQESLLEYESGLWSKGLVAVAGVDEAGRGPLAGPVVASAVILERGFAESQYSTLLDGLTDSKKLTASRREHFFAILSESQFAECSVGMSGPEEIDSINILQATYRSMARAVTGLGQMPEHVLVDGLPVAGLPCESTAIVKGDSLSLSIAAASIIAKVTRDRMMMKFHEQYPVYGFDSHKGYGSKRHIQALLEHGPCPIHRKSFRPVREAFEIRARKDEADPPASGQLELGVE
jgi:ribonuclease HII